MFRYDHGLDWCTPSVWFESCFFFKTGDSVIATQRSWLIICYFEMRLLRKESSIYSKIDFLSRTALLRNNMKWSKKALQVAIKDSTFKKFFKIKSTMFTSSIYDLFCFRFVYYFQTTINPRSYHNALVGLVCWVLWHINLCWLFNAKSIFMYIICSI